MFKAGIADPKVLNRAVDFMVLSLTFFVFCMLFSVASGTVLFFKVLAYSTILLLFVSISKIVIVNYVSPIGEASRRIVGNGLGILIGTGILLLFEILFSADSEILVAIIFSSIMAFFILGTLPPIVHKSSIMNKKSSSF